MNGLKVFINLFGGLENALYIAVKLEQMKTIKLSVEQAKELYNTNKEFRTTILHEFTDTELGIEPILRDWEDLEFKDTYCSTSKGDVFKQEEHNYHDLCYLNVPTEKHAKSMIAFAKLSMLMVDLGDECNVDWSNVDQRKYSIIRENNHIQGFMSHLFFEFLAFKTKSIRDAFLEKHERLIKDYFMID